MQACPTEGPGSWRTLDNGRAVEAAFAKYTASPASPAAQKFKYVHEPDGRSFHIDFKEMKRVSPFSLW